MPNVTLSSDMDAFLVTANDAAARTELGLGTLSTVTPGTGVATAAAINIGTAGSFVVNGGALGTPSSGNLAATSGYLVSNVAGMGTGVSTVLTQNVGSSGAVVTLNGAGGTPSSLTLTNGTGLPIAGISGLGTNVATALTQALNGSGAITATTSPTFVTPALGTPASGVATNLTSIPAAQLTGFLPSGTMTNPGLAFSGTGQTGSLGFFTAGSNILSFASNNNERMSFASAGIVLVSTGSLGFYSQTALTGGTRDTSVARGSAGVVNIGTNGSNALGSIALSGVFDFGKVITAAGTTGARTINAMSGSVNFAAAATSLVVTNSLVTANSVIVATIGNDSSAKSVTAVPAAGSFTLRPGTAPTAEVPAYFLIIN